MKTRGQNTQLKYDYFSNWEDYFLDQYESTVLWSLGRGYLNFNGGPIYLHSVNKQSILFYDACIQNKCEGVLVYPSIRLTITPLIALESLYYKMQNETKFKGRNKLLIISNRIELRNEIREHFISFKAGSLPLYLNVFPVGRVMLNGKIVKVSRTSMEPKLLISPNFNTMPSEEISKQIFGLIIEVTSDLNEEEEAFLREWLHKSGIPHLFWVSSEPTSNYVMKLIENGIPYWGWNAYELAEDCAEDEQNLYNGKFTIEQPFCLNYQEIQNKSSGVKKYIIPVKEDYLNRALKECRRTYLELLKAARVSGSKKEYNFAKDFLGCIYAIEEMTSPLAYTEEILERKWKTIPLSEKIDRAENFAELLRAENPIATAFGINSIYRLKDINNHLKDKKTGKHLVILQIIKEAIHQNKNLLIIAKNEAHKEALLNYLKLEKDYNESNLNSEGIFLSSVGKTHEAISSGHMIDTCILYGCPRYYNRNVLSFAKSKNYGILAYESEIPFIKTMIDSIEKNQDIFSSENKEKSLYRLNFSYKFRRGKKIPVDIKNDKFISKIQILESQDAEMGEFESEPIFSDFFSQDWSIDFEYSNEADSTIIAHGLGHKENVPAIKASIQGNRQILLYKEKTIQIYDETTEKVKDIPAKRLKTGDFLILIENSTRKSLASSIISKVESHPNIAECAVYQKAWIYFLREGIQESGDDFQTVIDKLKTKGAKEPSTAPAIYNWVNGAILGPKDLENIRRIGEIYHKQFLIDNWKEITISIKRLRSIHRSLARKLNNLIPKAGIEYDLRESENTLIDEELDLYLEDFSNIISIEKIFDVEEIDSVPVSNLDRVEYSHEVVI